MCGTQTLCGITATVSNNMNARSLQIGLFVQTEEWAWMCKPSLQNLLSHFKQRGWVSSFFTPYFPFLSKASLKSSENYAHCLIPDMDTTRQSVCRLQDK